MPLVGPTGQLFNELLHGAGIARGQVYILNTFETEVWKSKDERLVFDADGNTLFIRGKGLTKLGLEACQGTLERLARCGANVICPMGSIALDLLYGDTRITKWRGSILETELQGRIRKLVPSFHPTFLLYGNYIHKYTVTHDFKRLLEEARSPKRNLLQRNLYLNPSFAEAMAFLKDASRKPVIATDIECLNWHVSCFSVATSPTESLCIPLLDAHQQPRWSEDQELQIWQAYAKIMSAKNIRKINQNILFDMSFLFQQNNIFTAGPTDCCMIAHHMIYPDFPKGLDFLCSTYTREPYYKDDGKLWSKPWNNMEDFWRYNCRDSACAFEITEGLNNNGIMKQIKDEGHLPTYNNTIALFRPLMYMMVHGLLVDANRLATTRTKAKKLLRQRELDLKAIAEWDFNPASPKQCQEYFYVTKGFKPYTNIKTGGVTTDDKAMARIAKRYNLPEARLVQEIRGLRKLIGNYLEVKYDEDQRIRCSYNPRGTTTGRLSSGETVFGSGMNFCNLDPRFKDFLVADPVEIDD